MKKSRIALHNFLVLSFLFFPIIFLFLTADLAQAAEGYRFVEKWPAQQWYFKDPYGIAVDNNGFVYVADYSDRSIQKFTSSGELVAKWGNHGTDGRSDGPHGIAVDSTGYVYVAGGGYAHIQKFTADGDFVTSWGSEGTGDGQFDWPRAIAVDNSGFVYVADTGNSRIQKFTFDGRFILEWGGFGSEDGQLSHPKGIAVDSSGFIYVADNRNGRIQKFTAAGEFVTKWGSYGTEDGQFLYPEGYPTTVGVAGPYGIAVDNSGFVYVADTESSRIQKFTNTGQFIAKWGCYGNEDGQFFCPKGIAMDSSGFIYVADLRNERIQKFTAAGEFVLQWGIYGNRDKKLLGSILIMPPTPPTGPYGIAVDSSGFVYVADYSYHRIMKFTTEGQFVTEWRSMSSEDGWLWYPEGIAVDSHGFVYVADTGNSRIQKFSGEGTFVTKWGSPGSGNGQFSCPEGIAVDSSGFVYVADTNNHRVQKFTADGQFVTKWGAHGTSDRHFNDPVAVAVDNNSFIYVTDSSNARIQKFTADGEFVTQWGTLGSGYGQFNNPYGIAVASNGLVYVADTLNNRIQIFSKVTCLTPQAAFTATPTSGPGPLTVIFNNQSTNATSWLWNFGDGYTSTEENPIHTYIFPALGSGAASLTVSNECGSDTETVFITVTGYPIHVSALTVIEQTWNVFKRAWVWVQVIDANGNPVPDATVIGRWSNGVHDTDIFSTNANGWAVCASSWSRSNRKFRFCVSGIWKDGWPYDAAANVVTCAKQ